MDLDKVITLFTSKNSQELYERHLAAIERLCHSNATGFAIKDLPKVQQILEITLGLLLKGVPGFLQPAVGLIRVLSKPYIKKTATDEFRLLGNISNILACIGQIFTTPGYPVELQLATSELLIIFASGYGQRPSLLDKTPPVEQIDCGASARQYHTNQMLINSSGVLTAVVKSLGAAVSVGDEVLMMSLSLVASQMSYFPENANALLDAGLLHSLPYLFAYDYRHPLTPVAVQLLWNLLDFAAVATRVGLVTTPASQGSASQTLGTTRRRKQEGTQGSGVQHEQDGAQQQQQQQQGEGQHEECREQNRENGNPANGPMTGLGGEGEQTAPSGDATLGGFQGAAFGRGARSRTPTGMRPLSGQITSILPSLAHSLASLFLSDLLHGFRTVDKELRNDLVVVCSLIIGSDHPELPTANPISNSAQSATQAGVLCVHASPEEAWFLLDAVRAWALVRALLAFVEEVPEAAPHAGLASAALAAQRRWSPDQMDSLRAAALARLHALAPLCPEVYVEEGGPQVLLRFLGTSVHPAHMEGALRHLHHLVVSKRGCSWASSLAGDGGMEEILGAAGGVSVLVMLLQQEASNASFSEHHVSYMRALCLSVFQSTRNSGPVTSRAQSLYGTAPCANNNLRRFRHEGGVAMVLSQLARCESADRTLPSPYTVAVLDVIWACVVPDRKNTARFLVEDGLDALLSLLEIGNRGHRAVGLSLLADILSNPRSHSFFHEWRSHQDQSTAAHLLLRIWKEEDNAGGISDKQGVLANTALPLRGTGKPEAWIVPESLSYGTLLPGAAASGTLKGKQAGAGRAGATLHEQLGATSGPLVGALVPNPEGGVTAKLVPANSMQHGSTLARAEHSQGVIGEAGDGSRQQQGSGQHQGGQQAASVQQLETGQEVVRGQQAASGGQQAATGQQTAPGSLESKFYKKDRSQLTLAEIRQAKEKKETMLRNSIRDFQVSPTDLPGED
ncbi:hypothetical protein DUNSADRAFT_14196 [Dunaliella salina]|uniref:Cilia- and flagella-associated protein 69 ARM repeats domain-containing protein n=1 Tax=Dunaliella salina TaxID=3046 RepID=A0ABQ7G7V1_DUNSA|nr:hypothetical protein DUNSADRAFT_14196 [Dunaliella salina]|eukprot:KAF5830681.1 hypothetical protein DUNSADRAFT_14196 [Dunaliella salina]